MHLPTTPTGKKSLILSLALSLAGFLLILLSLNVYQYLRVKSDVASSMLQGINAKERQELWTFFSAIEEKLNIVRDWGKNGVLDSHKTVSLNKKFFPLINRQQRITGVLLADSNGWEYFLLHNNDHWLTRITRPGTKKNIAVYNTWEQPEKSIDTHEKQTDYDPRKRPWFHRSKNGKDVFWTPLYTFAETGKKGITASVSWNTQANKEKQANKKNFSVFGIDISLEEIQQLMNRNRGGKATIMFLVNAEGNSILPAQKILSARNGVDIEKLLSSLVRKWKTAGRPVQHTIRFGYNNQQWLASLEPLVQNETIFFLGVTAPEKELLTNLHKTLFSIDFTDFLVATAGGILLLFVIWKNGGFHQGDKVQIDPVVRLHALINEGEGAELEFKSTVRTNLKTGKKGKEIEFAWLKTIVAFMNSNGGILLIGVDDSGRITGVAADNFENNDRCLLHIKNLVNHHIGAEFSGFVNISLLTTDSHTVLMIEVVRAEQPVFLKIGKNEEFYIRSGPSSVKLSPSQMISYVLQNKGRRKK